MELRQLRYFTVLASELNFTRAADKLSMSQPPLSYQIASLEAELGARLFNRTSRSVELSEAGKALLPHALAVLQRIEAAREQVTRVAQGVEGRVTIGLSGSHFLGPFPQFIKQFRENRPGVELVLQEMRPSDHVHALRAGQLDISLTRGLPADGQLAAVLLWRDPVVLVVPLGHRLAKRTRVRLLELKGEDFVFLRLDSSVFAQRMFDACVAAGFAPRIVQQVIEIPSALNLVAAGLGISFVPASLAQLRRDAVAVCRLSQHLQASAGGEVNGDVYLLRRSSDQPPAVHEFADALRDWAGARLA